MPVKPKQNIVVPQVTFDKYWIQYLNISAPDVGGEVAAQAVLVPYNSKGEKDYSRSKTITFDNVMSLIASGNTHLANAMGAILAAVQAKEDA